MRRFDDRSPEARKYRRWYGLKAWKDRRAEQLATQPLCEYCLKFGKTTPATVADHVIPHKGDPDLFWEGELQSLCAPCHDRDKQTEEAGGGGPIGFDLFGYPITKG